MAVHNYESAATRSIRRAQSIRRDRFSTSPRAITTVGSCNCCRTSSKGMRTIISITAPAFTAPANKPVHFLSIHILTCPSEPNLTWNGFGASNYAGCHHDVEAPIDVDNHGVFFLNSRLHYDDIRDGASHTIFLAEKRIGGGDLGWASGTSSTLRNTGTPLNGTLPRAMPANMPLPGGAGADEEAAADEPAADRPQGESPAAESTAELPTAEKKSDENENQTETGNKSRGTRLLAPQVTRRSG